MEIELFSEDFADVIKDPNLAKQLRQPKVILGGEETQRKIQAVYEAVPRALARRLREIIPDGFDISEVQVKVTFKGTPLGVGIAGEALVKFAPK